MPQAPPRVSVTETVIDELRLDVYHHEAPRTLGDPAEITVDMVEKAENPETY